MILKVYYIIREYLYMSYFLGSIEEGNIINFTFY